VPDLNFQVDSAAVLEYAAVPSLLFKLRVENRQPEPVHSVTLRTQIRIATAQRHYSPAEQEGLFELFGQAELWGGTLKSMLWAHTVVLVPPFSGCTVVEMPVPCTYDFDVVSSKYFHALEEGEIPLEFLFSGTIFYAGSVGLQVVQIPWEKEAAFRLPVRLWKEMMEHYFPNSAWLRLRSDVFDRLYRYRARAGLPTWEAALECLLRGSEEGAR
jgi:hypothetical protein